MKRETIFNLLYVALIVGVIAFMIFMVIYLKSESAVCMKDPIQYFSEKTGQLCYCNDGLGWLRG